MSRLPACSLLAILCAIAPLSLPRRIRCRCNRRRRRNRYRNLRHRAGAAADKLFRCRPL